MRNDGTMTDEKVSSLKLTRRRMFTTLAVVGAGGAAAGAGTYAAFSDQETSSGNSVSATTLDLEVDPDGSAATTSISKTGIKPGNSNFLVIELKNIGRSSGTINEVELVKVGSNETGGDGTDDGADSEGNKDTTDGGEIEENTTVDLYLDPVLDDGTEGINSGSYTISGTDHTQIIAGTKLSAEFGTIYNPGNTLSAGGVTYLIYDYSIASGTGTDNDMQDDQITFDIRVNLQG